MRGLRVLALAALTVGCAVAAGASAARPRAGLLGCDGQQASPAFARFLDPIPYSLVPRRRLRGRPRLAPLGRRAGRRRQRPVRPAPRFLVAPAPCGRLRDEPGHLRRHARADDADDGVELGLRLLSPLKIEILYTTASGARRSALVGIRTGGSAWSPGLLPDVFLLAHLGPLLGQLGENGGLTTEVQFRLTSQSSFLLGGGRWRVDDVFVDPWVNGF